MHGTILEVVADVSGEQQTKTRTALDFFAKQFADKERLARYDSTAALQHCHASLRSG